MLEHNEDAKPINRSFFDKLDDKYSNKNWYEKAIRRIIHGIYECNTIIT